MKCAIGDKVRFLNEVGGGTVIRIIDKIKVSVLTEDGFEIPTLDFELVVIGKGDDRLLSIINEKKDDHLNKKEKIIRSDDLSKKSKINQTINKLSIQDLIIAFVPADIYDLNHSSFLLYLINSCGYNILYSLSEWKGNFLIPKSQNLLSFDSKAFIDEYESKELSGIIKINLQYIYYKSEKYTFEKPESVDFIIDTSLLRVANSLVDNDYFNKPSYILKVSSHKPFITQNEISVSAINESIRQKDLTLKPQIQKVNLPDIEEIDLHIHELVDNYQGMSPAEIIQLQLSRFETSLEGGIRSNKTKKMVFIHGLGNGKLKHEIRKLLDTKYGKLKYQDASFKEYGYGATLVYLK